MQTIWRSVTVIAPPGVPIPSLTKAGLDASGEQTHDNGAATARVPLITRVRISLAAWTLR
jgi:hypothetical protein